ncbi:hypothetical protein BJY52DRAFT_1195626 [Lactarius psammicola]|nr:hypothetical protein BJY52DRAFT_1195626 [Lactarius psammicola]
MEHRFDRSASKPGAAPAVTAADAAWLQVQVPFTLRTPLAINHGGAFELSFTPRAGTLEDLAVELYLGSGATGGGEWMYVPPRHTLCWSPTASASTTPGATCSSSALGRTATLRGMFSSGSAHPRPARAAQIPFAQPADALSLGAEDRPTQAERDAQAVQGRARPRVGARRVEDRVERRINE